jgi:uncharacterized membrane protein YgcG
VLSRLQDSLFGLGRRLAAVGSGFVDTFLRDNKVIPVVLALLALFVFAWIVAGVLLGGPREEPISNRAEVAQAQNPGEPTAPEVENRNLNSYAAYRFKDPFRQLFPSAESTSATTPTTTPSTTTPSTTTPSATTPSTTPTNPPSSGNQGGGSGGAQAGRGGHGGGAAGGAGRGGAGRRPLPNSGGEGPIPREVRHLR